MEYKNEFRFKMSLKQNYKMKNVFIYLFTIFNFKI